MNRGSGRLLAALALLATVTGCATVEPAAPLTEVTTSCSAVPGMGSACGPRAAEDIVAAPGGRWLLASGMNLGQGGHLYWIDRNSGRSFIAWPRDASASAGSGRCGSAPGTDISTTGLAIDHGRLLVVNGGGRKAIEQFDVLGSEGDHPALRWVDCVPLPADSGPNGVAQMGDGTLVATSFLEPGEPDPWGTLENGAPLGRLMTARADGTWQVLDLAPLSGANGLAVGADGKTLYVSEWGASRLLVVAGLARITRAIALPFRPDNIHPMADGTLLVAGQDGSPRAIGQCGAQCPLRWLVAKVDPASGAVNVLVDRAGTEQANYATAALEAGGKIYITVRGDNRVLVLDAKD